MGKKFNFVDVTLEIDSIVEAIDERSGSIGAIITAGLWRVVG
jgi:hypothetical protein